MADAVCLLKHMTSYGAKPLAVHQCQTLDYNGHQLPVPNAAIVKLQQSFKENKYNDPRIKDKQGIVGSFLDKKHTRWYYKNKQGQRVWVTWTLE